MQGNSKSSLPDFNSHLESVSEPARSMLSDLRSYVLSVGTNVIEQSRPHRIVYSKTFNMRIFLEVIPSSERLMLTLRYGRTVPSQTMELHFPDQLTGAKKAIMDAYEKIQ